MRTKMTKMSSINVFSMKRYDQLNFSDFSRF